MKLLQSNIFQTSRLAFYCVRSHSRPRLGAGFGFSHARFTSTTSKPRRSRLNYIWYGLCLASGFGIGHVVRNFACPIVLPIPGTREDELALEALAAVVDALPIVKQMRAQGYHLHSDTPLDSTGKGRGGWMEIEIRENIAEIAEDKDKTTRTITKHSLAGSKGFGVQRAFWNSETRELVAVVWFGGGMSGWPSIAHGGAIATMFQDAMARMIAGPNVSIDSVPPPTSVSVTYAQPTHILNYYVLRAYFSEPKLPRIAPPPEPEPGKFWLPSWKDLTKKVTSADVSIPTVELNGTLESLEGRVHVRAKGTFPASAVKA